MSPDMFIAVVLGLPVVAFVVAITSVIASEWRA